MKKVYLSNGEEVELLTSYQDGNNKEYVVKVIIGENNFEDETTLIYENRIVSNIYENYTDIPKYLKKTKLEDEVDILNQEVKELNDKKYKLTKELKSIYVPEHPLGTIVYYTSYGSNIEELRVIKIAFEEKEDTCSYYYYCNKEYRSFNKIGDDYHLTKKEAEKAQKKYFENKKIENEKNIKENFRKAKEEYDKLYLIK